MVSSFQPCPHTGDETLLIDFEVIALVDVCDGTLLTL